MKLHTSVPVAKSRSLLSNFKLFEQVDAIQNIFARIAIDLDSKLRLLRPSIDQRSIRASLSHLSKKRSRRKPPRTNEKTEKKKRTTKTNLRPRS